MNARRMGLVAIILSLVVVSALLLQTQDRVESTTKSVQPPPAPDVVPLSNGTGNGLTSNPAVGQPLTDPDGNPGDAAAAVPGTELALLEFFISCLEGDISDDREKELRVLLKKTQGVIVTKSLVEAIVRLPWRNATSKTRTQFLDRAARLAAVIREEGGLVDLDGVLSKAWNDHDEPVVRIALAMLSLKLGARSSGATSVEVLLKTEDKDLARELLETAASSANVSGLSLLFQAFGDERLKHLRRDVIAAMVLHLPPADAIAYSFALADSGGRTYDDLELSSGLYEGFEQGRELLPAILQRWDSAGPAARRGVLYAMGMAPERKEFTGFIVETYQKEIDPDVKGQALITLSHRPGNEDVALQLAMKTLDEEGDALQRGGAVLALVNVRMSGVSVEAIRSFVQRSLASERDPQIIKAYLDSYVVRFPDPELKTILTAMASNEALEQSVRTRASALLSKLQ